MHILKNVTSFCKGTVTVGKKINDLYQEYLTKYPATTVRAFEEALLQLDKIVIKNVQKKCQRYAQKYRGTPTEIYKSFITREEYISRNLWDKLLGYKPMKSKWCPGEGNSKLSPEWVEFSPEQKISFIRSCGDFLILDEIIKHERDPGVVREAHSKTNNSLVSNTIERVFKLTPKKRVQPPEQKKEPLPERVQTPQASEQKIIGNISRTEREKAPEPPEPPVKKKPDPDFKSMLPVNWGTMGRGERIDFVKKIQHKEFYKYVLDLDKNLEGYLTVRKIPEKAPKVSLYVNLFTFPSSVSEESKSLVKGLIESLNMLGRARLQYLELTEPPIIEIREVRR